MGEAPEHLVWGGAKVVEPLPLPEREGAGVGSDHAEVDPLVAVIGHPAFEAGTEGRRQIGSPAGERSSLL